MIYRIQYFFMQILAFIVTRLSFSHASRLAKTIGDIICACAPGRRKIALSNLDKAYGDTISKAQKETIVQKSFENTALSILELFLISKIKKNAADHFTILGLKNLESALSHGRGAVLITSHLGSWEYLEFLFYLSGIHCSVIVKSVKNQYLNRKIDRLRRETTVIPIPKKNAIREVLAELKRNNVVAIVVDQWAGKDGLWGDFFGTPTSTTSLPARLAQKMGCALVPGYCVRKGDGRYEIQVHPPILFDEGEPDQEGTVTKRLNQMLETQILKYPEQWSWAHRRWKNKPGTSREIKPESE